MDLPDLGSDFQGKYRIDDILGEGGFARVYAAQDVGAKRKVALKILKPISGAYQSATESRFQREVKMIGNLRDPHTVTLFDFGQTDEGLLYMVFEFVPGTDLSEVIKAEGVLSPEATIHILTQVLKSLREAHQHGLLHRDIKPQNIQISEYMGDPLRVTLLDFGIAKPVKPGPELSAITHAGALVGTPQYMSPEQLLEQEMTPASDIYSLGLVAYEMLVGEPAVAGNALSDQLRILGGTGSLHLPPSVSVPLGLRRVVDRMIAKDQSNRMQSAEQVLRALEVCHIPSGDVSLDETGALAPVGSVDYMRPITGAQAAPPTTGEQFVGAMRSSSSEFVPVTAPAYATGNGYYGSSDSMMRPAMPHDQSHSSAHIPVHVQASHGTTVIAEVEDEPSVWLLAGAAAALMLLVAATAYFVLALDDDGPTQPRVLPPMSTAPSVEVAPRKSPREVPVITEPVVEPADGCGVEPDHRGDVTVAFQNGPLDPEERVPVYLPKSYDANTRYPLIVAFHDFPGGPRGIMSRSRLRDLAEEHGVVIAAWDDSETLPPTTGYWHSKADVLAARRATEHVLETFCIDRRRIFGYGHGAGGRAVTRLACEFHGIAATATTAYRPEEESTIPSCDHERPVPHLSFEALLDKGAPPEGGAGCGKFVNPVISIEDYESRLRQQGGCTKKSAPWFEHRLGECVSWSCEAAARVTCRVKGGREFPGTKLRDGIGIDPSCDGRPADFPYADLIWKFFDEAVPAAVAEGE